MNKFILAWAFGLALFSSASAAPPQSPPPQHCASPVLPADQRIKACLAATRTKGVSRDQEAADFMDLASAYEAWGNRELELDALSKAITLKPDLWDARLQRANLLLPTQSFLGALPDYQALHAAFPAPAPVLKGGKTASGGDLTPEEKTAFMIPSIRRQLAVRAVRRCQNRALTGLELNDARKDCAVPISMGEASDADEAAKKNAEQGHEFLGIIEFRGGNWTRALANFEAVLKADPKSEVCIYLRGITERRMGNTAKGDADIAAAKKSMPGLTEQANHAGLLP